MRPVGPERRETQPAQLGTLFRQEKLLTSCASARAPCDLFAPAKVERLAPAALRAKKLFAGNKRRHGGHRSRRRHRGCFAA